MTPQRSKLKLCLGKIAESNWVVWMIIAILFLIMFLAMFREPKSYWKNKFVCPLGSDNCTKSQVEYTGGSVTAVEINNIFYKTNECTINEGHDVCSINGSYYEIQ